MATFNGQLNSNELFSALYNMIISQQVFAANIKGTGSTLVDKARVDGGLYGDSKLYYATDVLKSVAWGNDAEAANLLALHRPAAPECQAIVIDQFRQIALTVDNYLSKRAWSTEGAFNQFTSVMLGWIRDTKKVYDSTVYNTFVGTEVTNVGSQLQTITLPVEEGDAEATNRLQAEAIAEKIANIAVEMEDISRDYNDYGNLRSLSKDEIQVIWNSEWVNKIKKVDVPTIFGGEAVADMLKNGDVLPARYFGTKNAAGGTTSGTNITIRSLVEKDYGDVHVFPGDLLPASTAYLANETYTVDPSVVCKITVKGSVPYMSAFEVGTSFFNPKSLTETHYLTFGHNTLEHLKNYPFVTVKAQAAS